VSAWYTYLKPERWDRGLVYKTDQGLLGEMRGRERMAGRLGQKVVLI
jgi:hypothetical protein